MDGTSVAGIIPTWNSLDVLPRCLDSLEAQAPAELLVVDNGSTDGTAEYLERRGVPTLALPRNLGFAPAVNLGAARTSAAALLVLNADTELEPGAIEALREALHADPSLGGVQPHLLQIGPGGDRSTAAAVTYSAGQALRRDGRAYEIGMGAALPQGQPRRGEVFGVCGAACLLRRQLFDDLGGYDERYFAFYEDVDLNVRARIAGWRFELIPEALVWHVGNTSWMAGFERPAADNARLVARNRLATQAKFMPLAALPRIALVEVGALLRAARQRRFLATLAGKLEALPWLRALWRDRQRLEAGGDPALARAWLGA